FWLGTRLVFASGSPIDHIHTHVFRLRLEPSLTARLIGVLLDLLSRIIQTWAKTQFLEWFLPANVILKKQKEGQDNEFEKETHTYAKLREKRGVVIPACHGIVSCSGGEHQSIPVLVLSDVGCAKLCEPE
ncbi:hypothetical protein B0T26DRAFT_614329, partial [Lasiosphaeria miniovina]